MSRTSTVALAFILAVLAATAPIAIAQSTNQAVASIHSTGSDFNNGSLGDVTVEGSGDDADVVFTSEDEPWNISDVSHQRDVDISSQATSPDTLEWSDDGSKMYIGATGSIFEYEASEAYNVSTVSFERSASINNPAGMAWSDDGTTLGVLASDSNVYEYEASEAYNVSTLSLERSTDVSSEAPTPRGFTWGDGGDKMFVADSDSNGDIFEYELSEAYNVSTASFERSMDTSGEETVPQSVEWHDDGSRLYIVGTGSDTVHEYDAAEAFNVSTTSHDQSLDVSSEDGLPVGIEWNSGGTKLFVAGSDNDRVYEYGGLDYTPSGTYISDTHTVDRAASGFANLTLDGVTADVTWQEHDGSSWSDIASDTFTTTGNHTVDISGASESDLRVNVTFSTDGSGTGELHDEGVTFTNTAPTVDNSSASPSGGEQVTSAPVTLEIDTNDVDFESAQSDGVEVTFVVNGTTVGTDTLTSNGTASVDYEEDVGGVREWHAELEDDYGGVAQSDSFLFETPSTLSIRDERNPSQLVDDVNVTLRFYLEDGSETIIEQTTDDGTIDFVDAGLSVGDPFVVDAEAEGYFTRRIFVDSLFESQSVYLLNETAEARQPTFILRDYTSNYPRDDTVLQVERAINGSWQTVEGDFFGASGRFSAQLDYNVRHRLVIQNIETGQTRNLGSFIPVQSQDITVQVNSEGDVDVLLPDVILTFLPDPAAVAATNSTVIEARLSSGSAPLDDYDLTVVYENGSFSTTLLTENGSAAPGDTIDATLDLTDRAGGVLNVTLEYQTADGSGVVSQTYTVREARHNQYALVALLGDVADAVPAIHAGVFTTVLAVLVTVVATTAAASRIPMSTELVGLTAIAFLAAFAEIGFIGWPIVFAGGGAWVAFAGIRRGL